MNKIFKGFASTPKRSGSLKKFLRNAGKNILLGLLIFAFAVGGYFNYPSAPKADAALVPGGAVGPVVPSGLGKGFPAWYMDQNGMAVDLMEAADGFGISDPVDPANNFSQELGFNAEGFYWSADAIPANTVNTISGEPISGILVLALEAAFAGEAAVDGEQSVFGRIRYRVDGLIIGETYTVVHPFGTETAVATDSDGNGPKLVGDINVSSDIGCFATAGVLSCNPNNPPGNPNNFGLALQSGIGPFLTWSTFNDDFDPVLPGIQPDPQLINPANTTKRYIGNPNVTHAVKGGPNSNSFTVTGAGISSFTTDLFTVTGRIAEIDTVPPVIGATSPSAVNIGAANFGAFVNVTDDLGVRTATIDLGPLSNNFAATLNGGQVVPPTPSLGTGNGAFVIDTVANTLSFNITVGGLVSPETAAHIHGPVPAGANTPDPSPIFFALPGGPTKTGVWNYPETAEADILAGRTYVVIHTISSPEGEIRGQILPQSDVRSMTRTAGTITNGTWFVLIPSAARLGTFNLPMVVSDGSNVTTGNFVLNVVPILNSVTVTPAASTIFTGATQQLTAAGSGPAGPIVSGLTTVWTSSNTDPNPLLPQVASVDANGLVTGLNPGTATITATMTNGVNTVSGTATVTVNQALVLTTVTVTPASATIAVGATQTFVAAPKDQFGNVFVGATIAWDTDALATMGTINPTTGVFTAAGAGGPATVIATATSGATTVIGTATITVTAGAVCQTGADTDGNGAISNLEILNYVRDWKGGLVSNLLILKAIGFWKAGAGC